MLHTYEGDNQTELSEHSLRNFLDVEIFKKASQLLKNLLDQVQNKRYA